MHLKSSPLPALRKACALTLVLVVLLPFQPAFGLSLAEADQAKVQSGILLDLGLDLAGAAHYDGLEETEAVSPAVFRQLLFQMKRTRLHGRELLSAADLRELAAAKRQEQLVPLALLDMDYERLDPLSLEKGWISLNEEQIDLLDERALEAKRLFLAAALNNQSYQGSALNFQLPAGEFWITNRLASPTLLEWDFDDGAGFVSRTPGEIVPVSYTSTGEKTLKLRATWADGDTRITAFSFNVIRLETPSPTETWNITSSYSYGGAAASGNAYVYLADGHSQLTKPIVLCEGFDMDNQMFWPELYELTNQQDLVITLRALGYDAVVLNFTESTDYIQRNGLLLATLLEQINSVIPTGTDYPLIGASMGGLVSRYALAWLESQGIDHQVRTFVSFDSPQLGANIPLSLQYWLAFFSSESEEAAHFISRLQTPAARQMLLLLAQSPPQANPQPDPLRQVFLDDLASLGGYPTQPRLVAVANGSGSGISQGFNPGDQIIYYVYRNWLVDIDGNCWSLRDHQAQTIFQGMINIIWPLPDTYQTVNINGAAPWDGAPGGWRNSMLQLDQSAVPYGDVIALHHNHCFIPTVSALALSGTDPFMQIAGTPDLPSLSPFDALYFPTGVNEEHVEITPDSVWWILAELVPELPAPTLNIQLVDDMVELAWTAIPATRSYRIERSEIGGGWSQVATSTGTSYSEPAGEAAFYRVIARMEGE
jgi:hypothetical protein